MWIHKDSLPLRMTILFLTLACSPAFAGDWPTWRYDARRGAATPDALPDQLHLQWFRDLPPQRTAWPASQKKLQFDKSYEPVVAGKRMFVGSTVNDGITAYDTDSGETLWRFFTDGPVRFAPVVEKGKLYAVSDDGSLYCLQAADGRLIWNVNGGPAERRILGNGRLVSNWTPRGGPVLADGTVYFTAGIWPSMGIFIHAVDAQSGRILWTNSETGLEFTVHPHRASSFGSVVPQGYLAVSGEYLIVPGGRSLPAVLDRKTGKVVHFDFGGKSSGGFAVLAAEKFYIVGEEMFDLATGNGVASANLRVLSDNLAIGNQTENGPIVIHPLAGSLQEKTTSDRRGRKEKKLTYVPQKVRRITPGDSAPTKVWLKAGDRIYTGDINRVAAFDVNGNSKPVWHAGINGTIGSMLAADDKLFVVTEEGRIYCFGAQPREAGQHRLSDGTDSSPQKSISERARQIVEITGAERRPRNNADPPSEETSATQVREPGFGVVYGAVKSEEILALSTLVNLHLIVIDPNAEAVDRFRRQADAAGVYGVRVTAHVGNPRTFSLPPYLADLAVCFDAETAGLDFSKVTLNKVYQSLRPYGGTACLKLSAEEHARFAGVVSATELTNAEVRRSGEYTLLRRVGSLPGSGVWSHQYADSTNSVVSKDRLVKVPLGVLWFGGPPNDKTLPRHGHGPSPQVAGGRLVIEGPDLLRAVDVYTGRLLWEKELEGIGTYYNITRHFPGAGEIGSNYVTLPDSVYAIHDRKILQLDAASGRQTREYVLQPAVGDERPHWGFIAADGDYLIAASSPLEVKNIESNEKRKRAVVPPDFEPLIEANETWRYLAGSDPSGKWTALAFDDSGWKTGRAGFGYGDKDDRTLLNDMQGNYTRVYLRKTFDAGKAGAAEALTLMVNFDDAFIAYLNGREIARQNVGSGNGPDAKKVGSHEADGYEAYSIPNVQKLLQKGRNVLALEGHNRSISSSDFTLDPFLLYKPKQKSESSDDAAENESPAKQTPAIEDAFRPAEYSSASRQLVVFNRNTGELLWKRQARFNFRHNSIVAAAGKVFCIDGLSPDKMQAMKRRGIDPSGKSRLLALDVKTGREAWSADEDVFGTFLNYSDTHDVLLQAGSAYKDRARDEVDRGMVAYRGSDGKVLWKDLNVKYGGPCLLWRDKIITNGGGGFQLELLTGQRTGWTYSRMYGCNTAVGSQNLITFRSGAAGFCDLDGNSGTGNIGGFRSSCTANLIAADGVLNAPDYTRTCSCAYQIQTSLALVHMPEEELWTFNNIKAEQLSQQRFGLNLGAPGDRRGPEGTLWLDYPAVGGPSPSLDVTIQPENINWFRRHSSQLAGSGLKWIAASGGTGIETVTLKLGPAEGPRRSWTVRLHFSEPENAKPGQRVFSVALQDRTVLHDFDVVKEAGGQHRAVVKEFPGVSAAGSLSIKLVPAETSQLKPVLCGIELVAE